MWLNVQKEEKWVQGVNVEALQTEVYSLVGPNIVCTNGEWFVSVHVIRAGIHVCP